MKKLVLLSIGMAIGLSAYAGRTVQSFNEAWYFSPLNSGSYSEYLLVTTWEPVHIPHTWNTEAYGQRNYRRGSSWYKKEFRLDAEQIGNKQLYLKFDAINSLADIYLNGELLTTHKGGYSAFTIDITNHIKEGQTNQLAIRVNNENCNIPPLSGDFTIFGGIYRDIWLIATEKQHFTTTNYASDGVFITLPKVSKESADIVIRGKISNHTGADTDLHLQVEVIDKDEKIISGSKQKVKAGKDQETAFTSSTRITNPELWSPDSPYLYKVRLTLTDKQGTKVKDELTLPLGVRWFSVDTARGFQLNDKPLKLMGVCRHQDQAPMGIGLSDEMHRRDIKLIKEMGANFIRIAHYQQDDAVLRACDELGLLVWEEIPIVDLISLEPIFAGNAETALSEMVHQHYNHPSIVMWGYMNEAVIQLQYRVKKNQLNRYYEKTLTLARQLEIRLKQEDPYRLSTMAYHGNQIYNEIGLSNITDISGWNLYQGWYENDLMSFDRFVDEEHRKYPARPLLISEFGAGSDPRLQSLQPEIFDFSIQWQQTLLEHYLPAIIKRPFIIGGTEWNFIDFSSASRQEATPHINNKGLVYNDRTPKDVYYYFQAFLRKDIPVVHIAVNDWKYRTVVSDGDAVTHPIKVYSNLPQLTLYINNEKAGEQTLNNSHATWNIPLKRGRNTIRVEGYFEGEIQERTTDVFIEMKPQHITTRNAGQLELAVNVGSNCYFTDDKSNLCWLPDKPYTPGSWGYIGGGVYRKSPGRIGTTTHVKGTHNVPLLQTMRQDIEGYCFDLPNGEYELELLFADLNTPSEKLAYDLSAYTQSETQTNIFDVWVNDECLLKNFSPAIEVGGNRMVNKKVPVKVINNQLKVNFERKRGSAFLNAIKILKQH